MNIILQIILVQCLAVYLANCQNNENLTLNNEFDYDYDYNDGYLTTTSTVSDDDYGHYGIEDFPDPPLLDLYTLRTNPKTFASSILFIVTKNGKATYNANGTSKETLEDLECSQTDDFTFIIHGWREDTRTEWIPWMVSNFTKYRGGCIIAIDYGAHTFGNYLRLVQQFDDITDVIFRKMKLWKHDGMNLGKTLIFGFSFGGQIAIELGKRFGRQKIQAIDTCDIAGPGFDVRDRGIHHRNAAKNVQCIHTSRDKGTRHYNTCHQNWRLGNCGFKQPGAEAPPYGSHGLCVYYYLLSFEHNFVARQRPRLCLPTPNEAFKWPNNFKMGYMEKRKSQIQGEFFVPLLKDPPYVIPDNYIGNNFLFNRNMLNLRNFQNGENKFLNRPVVSKLIRASRIFLKRSQIAK